MEEILKQMLVEAHRALDEAHVPTRKIVPRLDRPAEKQEITLSVAERIKILAGRL